MEERRLRLQEAANRCAPSRWAWVLGSRGRVGVPAPAACSPVLPLQEVLQSGCPDPRGAGAAGTLRSHPRVRAGPRESAGAGLQLRGAGRGSCRPAGVGSSLPPRPGLLGCSLGRGHPTVGVLPCPSPRSPALQDWPKHWRAKLKRSPGDLSLVTSLVSHLLRYQGLRPPPLVVAERIIMRSVWGPGGAPPVALGPPPLLRAVTGRALPAERLGQTLLPPSLEETARGHFLG